jgi:hypothetical protein
MRTAISVTALLSVLPYAFADDVNPGGGVLPAGTEVVMSPGMRITATTTEGTIAITAVDELTRSYTWEGSTRSAEMSPRTKRWYGSLGLYFPGSGEHWADHHGIARGVLEEGQQHFKSIEEAMQWIKARRDWIPQVYRNDGLLIAWGKTLPRKQLSVDVWQVLIDGRKPERLPGSQNDQIVVETVQAETSPLVQAVQKKDLKAVDALLGKDADPNAKNSIGRPALIMAAKMGSAPIVEALLKKGADINARDEEGSTALLNAVRAHRTEVVRILLAGGASVDAAYQRAPDKGDTPLIVAAMMGKGEIVQLLIEKDADTKARGSDGLTALIIAAMMGKEEIVQLLIEKGGADVNQAAADGRTPLGVARLMKREGIVRRLQNAGAGK